ncbi:MAG: hypothetical protein F6J94_01170 [Moorea sp. SIO1F2]|uniref:hypothetical protein n=1 Tax=unclassified Moorena TaxID=2683338 RepID=UPI0013BAB914|nr:MULTISPECIES: hypothetical protein [unclassified Moorena]NEP20882.1 hypothetical protein [Moorena sp. SIO3I6]NET80644.1 hypothetical protein [Moorena sp. SIO1F2]
MAKLLKLLGIGLELTIAILIARPAWCLPPPEDLPEEVLRTEIIIEARSPLDGKPMNPAEYAQLQDAIAQRSTSPGLDPKIRELIFLLQLSDLFRTILPF